MKFFDLEMSGLAGGGVDRDIYYANSQGTILPKCQGILYTNGTGFFSCLSNSKEGKMLAIYNTSACTAAYK